MSHYSNGTAREYAVRDALTTQGWTLVVWEAEMRGEVR